MAFSPTSAHNINRHRLEQTLFHVLDPTPLISRSIGRSIYGIRTDKQCCKRPLPSRTISFCVCIVYWHAQTCQLTTSSDAEALRIHAGGPSFVAELSAWMDLEPQIRTLSCIALAFIIFCCHYALAVALVCILHACMQCIHVFMWVLSVYSAL
jgi:hypothetical protein